MRKRPHMVALRMNRRERKDLKLLAAAEGVTVSEAIRRAVREKTDRIAGASS